LFFEAEGVPSNIQDPSDQQYYLTLKTQRYEARRKQLIQAAISVNL